jgi:hypothetical protein
MEKEEKGEKYFQKFHRKMKKKGIICCLIFDPPSCPLCVAQRNGVKSVKVRI